MNKKTFDVILRQNVVNTDSSAVFGYAWNDRNYSDYYREDVFKKFADGMEREYPQHYQKYIRGKGSELKPNGDHPPKMASVGSSSRFCYLAFRNYDSVEFEHACPIDGIKGGTPPQMDAYFFGENIFAEVKCHEIFDSHKIELSAQYRNLLFCPNNDFGFPCLPADSNVPFTISGSAFGLRDAQTLVDIKQLLCHLLGIRSHKKPDEDATLLYLFFWPKVKDPLQKSALEMLFSALQAEICTVFGGPQSPIRKFAEKNRVKLVAVAQYAEVMSPLTTENTVHLFPKQA